MGLSSEVTHREDSVPVVQESYEGTTAWSQLAVQPETAVYHNDETLTMSATGLKSYMDCPRQYFYGKVLTLKTPQHPAALVGSLVHALMEAFNRQVNQGLPFTANSLASLAEALFALNTDMYPAWLLEGLQQLPLLAQSDLKDTIQEIIEDLSEKGFFKRTPKTILPEVSFEFSLAEIPRVRFTGKIDALVQWGESGSAGYWEVVDYKHYGPTAFAQKSSAKRLEKLTRVLEPLALDALEHSERYPAAKERNYQIPLYAWAAHQDARLQEVLTQQRIHQVTIQLLRPRLDDDNGAIALSVDCAHIDAHYESLTQDIHQGFMVPIRQTRTFIPSDDPPCDFCAFARICDYVQQSGAGSEAL